MSYSRLGTFRIHSYFTVSLAACQMSVQKATTRNTVQSCLEAQHLTPLLELVCFTTTLARTAWRGLWICHSPAVCSRKSLLSPLFTLRQLAKAIISTAHIWLLVFLTKFETLDYTSDNRNNDYDHQNMDPRTGRSPSPGHPLQHGYRLEDNPSYNRPQMSQAPPLEIPVGPGEHLWQHTPGDRMAPQPTVSQYSTQRLRS